MNGEKGFLHTLTERWEARGRKTKREKQCRYDTGMAIDLRYDPSYYPGPSGGAAAAVSVANPYWEALAQGPLNYQVESFEEQGEEDEMPVWGTSELEEEEYEAYPSRAASLSEGDEGEAVAWGTAELEEIDAGTAVAASLSDAGDILVWGTAELEDLDSEAAAAMTASAEEEAPVWGTGELELIAADGDSNPQTETFSTSVPAARMLSRRVKGSGILESSDLDTQAFAQDLEAILAGKKEHPSTAPSHVIREQTPDEEEVPQPAQEKAYASGFSHNVFDSMGKNMSTATTFELGSYRLAHDFDLFDRRLDSKERRAERRLDRMVMRAHTATPPSRNEFVEDMAWLAKTPASAAAHSEITASRAFESPAPASAPAYDLRLDVPLIPQQTGFSCWAAGAAMLVAWRDQMSIDPSEIARATGAWAAYKNGLNPEDVSVFPIWGMAAEPSQSYTVPAFFDLLSRYGPLWVASAEPGPHIRVVTGIWGDGTADGTTLFVNDPWEAGMTSFRLPNTGARTSETYAQFLQKQETLARTDLKIPGAVYIAHLREQRAR